MEGPAWYMVYSLQCSEVDCFVLRRHRQLDAVFL